MPFSQFLSWRPVSQLQVYSRWGAECARVWGASLQLTASCRGNGTDCSQRFQTPRSHLVRQIASDPQQPSKPTRSWQKVWHMQLIQLMLGHKSLQSTLGQLLFLPALASTVKLWAAAALVQLL